MADNVGRITCNMTACYDRMDKGIFLYQVSCRQETENQRTLERKVGGQHADEVEWNLSSVSVIKVDTEQLLIIRILIVVIRVIARRMTDSTWMKTGELLTPVSTDSSTDRQLRLVGRTNNQHLQQTHTTDC